MIPLEVRDRLHVRPGDELVLQESSGQVFLKSYDQVLAEAQSYFQSVVSSGASLVDELIADRRAEAAREAAEVAGEHD